jgi:nucleoside 2-deoxyribosyltransferase
MLLYVAGPYTADTPEGVQENIKAANEVAVKLWEAGHTVICPHLNTLGIETVMDTPEIIRQCCKLIQRCDAIVVIKGWERSEGTKQEMGYAQSNGLSIYMWENCKEEGIPLHLTEQRCPVQCDAFLSEIMSLYRVHLSKNADYSPANILGTGEVGVTVRLWDKMARIMNLMGFDLKVQTCEYNPHKRSAKHEAIEDSFLDMSCYAIIAKLLKEGKWGR